MCLNVGEWSHVWAEELVCCTADCRATHTSYEMHAAAQTQRKLRCGHHTHWPYVCILMEVKLKAFAHLKQHQMKVCKRMSGDSNSWSNATWQCQRTANTYCLFKRLNIPYNFFLLRFYDGRWHLSHFVSTTICLEGCASSNPGYYIQHWILLIYSLL